MGRRDIVETTTNCWWTHSKKVKKVQLHCLRRMIRWCWHRPYHFRRFPFAPGNCIIQALCLMASDSNQPVIMIAKFHLLVTGGVSQELWHLTAYIYIVWAHIDPINTKQTLRLYTPLSPCAKVVQFIFGFVDPREQGDDGWICSQRWSRSCICLKWPCGT